jgi:hypothetical protein
MLIDDNQGIRRQGTEDIHAQGLGRDTLQSGSAAAR